MKKHEDFLTDASRLAPAGAKKNEKESLGERIRTAREMRGLTLEDISSRTGIDVATLKRIESTEIAPPLGQLIRLGKALDMKMGYFISPGVDKPMTVVRKGQGQSVARYGKKERRGIRLLIRIAGSGKSQPHDGAIYRNPYAHRSRGVLLP